MAQRGFARAAAQQETVRESATLFRRIYMLPIEAHAMNVHRHEGCHVVTGMGVTSPDEERVAIYDAVLNRGYHTGEISTPDRKPADFDFALEIAKDVKREDLAWLAGKMELSYYCELHTPAWREIQFRTEPVFRKELYEHWQLAREVEERIARTYGKYFYQMSDDEIASMRTAPIDVSARAGRIVKQHQSATNKALEDVSVLLFQERARELGRSAQDCQRIRQFWRGAHYEGARTEHHLVKREIALRPRE